MRSFEVEGGAFPRARRPFHPLGRHRRECLGDFSHGAHNEPGAPQARLQLRGLRGGRLGVRFDGLFGGEVGEVIVDGVPLLVAIDNGVGVKVGLHLPHRGASAPVGVGQHLAQNACVGAGGSDGGASGAVEGLHHVGTVRRKIGAERGVRELFRQGEHAKLRRLWRLRERRGDSALHRPSASAVLASLNDGHCRTPKLREDMRRARAVTRESPA